jgi:predicted RNase H-like HicB family nuclease
MDIPAPEVEQDEDGVWCARIVLRPGVAAFGDGSTRDEALEDVNAALRLLLEGVDDDATVQG